MKYLFIDLSSERESVADIVQGCRPVAARNIERSGIHWQVDSG